MMIDDDIGDFFEKSSNLIHIGIDDENFPSIDRKKKVLYHTRLCKKSGENSVGAPYSENEGIKNNLANRENDDKQALGRTLYDLCFAAARAWLVSISRVRLHTQTHNHCQILIFGDFRKNSNFDQILIFLKIFKKMFF